MRIFAVFFVVFAMVCAVQSKSLEDDVNERSKRELSQDKFIAVKEGDVWAYVARRKYEGNLIVGKYIKEWNKVYIPYFGKEYEFQDDIEVLKTNGRHMWIPYPGHVPSNAILGGKEGSADLYIGRKWQWDKFLIGKIVVNAIFCPHFGKELRFDDNFEILVEEEK